MGPSAPEKISKRFMNGIFSICVGNFDDLVHSSNIQDKDENSYNPKGPL